MAQLKKGDKAPSFQLVDQNEKKVKLTDYKQGKLLLYFYPKANTGGCTKQAISVSDARKGLSKLGVAVVGISPDTPQVQKKFDDKHTLGFPLLSDPDHKVAEAYGVWGEKSMYGKKFEGIIRSSFLIDNGGKIIEAWYKVSPKDTVPKALEALSAASE
jgi:peroxiredoxin Q/BCP